MDINLIKIDTNLTGKKRGNPQFKEYLRACTVCGRIYRTRSRHTKNLCPFHLKGYFHNKGGFIEFTEKKDRKKFEEWKRDYYSKIVLTEKSKKKANSMDFKVQPI